MLAFLCSLFAVSALAQDAQLPLPPAPPPPANLAVVEGAVDLIHEGATDRAAAPVMLVDGDIVRTLNGRAEIVFADGTLLHLDHDTALEVLGPTRVRLVEGRVLLRTSAAATAAYVVDAQAGSIRAEPRGEYGVTSQGRLGKLELTVARGVAEVEDAGARTVVRGGEMATILGTGGRVHLETFNSARWDSFARWSNDRTNGFASSASARQLPQELRPYGQSFDTYGYWDQVAPYGQVWFPRVAAGWRPYYSGAWASTRWGSTWIGHDPWAWPTHHFGRWGFSGAAWYWVPHNVWGPAWVSWSFVPGYVSWRPLYPRDHPAYWPNYDPWRSWTVMPRHHFGGRRAVRTHALDPWTLPEDTRHRIASAVPRGTISMPGAIAGAPRGQDVAVPRDAGLPDRRIGPRPGNVRSPYPVRSLPPPRAADPQRRDEPPRQARENDAPTPAPGSIEALTRPFTTSRTDPRAEGAAETRRGRAREPESAPAQYPPPQYTPRAEESRAEAGSRAERGGDAGYARPRAEGQERTRDAAPPPRSERAGSGERGGGPREGGGPTAGKPSQAGRPPQGGAARRRPGGQN